jgi:iron-sulfur cluster repair protein YtfE (RIC family)
MSVTNPVREEHGHLQAGIELLREAGDHVGALPFAQAHKEVSVVLEFLHDHLIPHARSEDEYLYPTVGKLMGSPAATRTMSRDHVEVGVLAGQLERAAEEWDEPVVRRLLYGLYHVVRLHLAKEEEIYLPLLDEHLTRAEAEEIFHHAGLH